MRRLARALRGARAALTPLVAARRTLRRAPHGLHPTAVSIEEQIHQLVDAFVANITKLARQAAVETLSSALSGGSAAGPISGMRRQLARTVVPPRGRRRKGEKRPASDIAALQRTLLDHVRKHPGDRVEQINAVLGTATKDVRLPLANLIGSGKIKTKGTRRATKYFPA